MLDVLFTVLILLPIPPVATPACPYLPPEMLPSLQRVAHTLDLVGPGERWNTNLASELRWCWYAWRELRDCPPSALAAFLPPYEECRYLLAGNREFRRHLMLRRQVLRQDWDQLTECLYETDRLGRFWQACCDATDPQHGVKTRRLALRKVFDCLGEHGMPPAVPYSQTTP